MLDALVCLISPVSDDPYHVARNHKRGDIICVQPSEHGWGTGELTNPNWRILRFAKATESELQALTSQEVATGDNRQTLHLRGFYLDIDSIADAAFQAYLADSFRIAPVMVTDLTVADLKKGRSTLPDPAIIGDPPSHIG